MQLGNGIYYSTCSLNAQHVSSGMSLVIGSSDCICGLWFTYVCGDCPVVKSEWELSSHSDLTTGGHHTRM